MSAPWKEPPSWSDPSPWVGGCKCAGDHCDAPFLHGIIRSALGYQESGVTLLYNVSAEPISGAPDNHIAHSLNKGSHLE